MEKIKDFIYDKNDILVALLVLVLAAFLICWRMDVIMEYPEKMFSGGDTQIDTDVSGDAQDGEGDQSGDGEGGGDADQSGEGDANQAGDGDDSGDVPAVPSGSLWEGGVLTRDVEVDVYGNSAMAAVQCLVDAGLFEDYNEYKNICDNSGLNHEKVSAGSLIFEKGTTKEQVARKINWS